MMDVHLSILFVLLPITSQAININGTTLNCISLPSTQVNVYDNWPFLINCKYLMISWRDFPAKNGADVLTNTCQIIDQSHQFKPPGLLEKFNIGSNVTAYMELDNKECIVSELKLVFMDLPATCSQFLRQSYMNNNVVNVSGEFEVSQKFECVDPNLNYLVIPEGLNRNDFKTIWYNECDPKKSILKSKNNHQLIQNPPYPDSIELLGPNFWHIGNYTCAVQYKNLTFFVVQYDFCMKQNKGLASYKPNFTCSGNPITERGGTVSLSCNGSIFTGITKYGELNVAWKKGNIEICRNKVFNETEGNGKYSCLMKSVNSSRTCYNILPEDHRLETSMKKVNISLTIRNADSEDFSNIFHVELNLNGYPSSSAKVNVLENRAPFIRSLIRKLVPSAVVLVLLICLTIVLVRKYMLEIKILIKRVFGDYLIKDNKDYDIYLLYDVDIKNNPNEAKMVRIIRNVIIKNTKDYSLLDEGQDTAADVRIEKISNNVKNSQYVFLIVTETMIQNVWERFKAEVMVNAQKPIVFIFTPGNKKLLSKTPGWKLVAKVARVSHNINWHEKMTEHRLEKHIKYALPKLKKSISNDTTMMTMQI